MKFNYRSIITHFITLIIGFLISVFIFLYSALQKPSPPVIVESDYIKQKTRLDRTISTGIDSIEVRNDPQLAELISLFPDILVDTIYKFENDSFIHGFSFALESGLMGYGVFRRNAIGKPDLIELYNYLDIDLYDSFRPSFILRFAFRDKGFIVYNSIYDRIEECVLDTCWQISFVRRDTVNHNFPPP